MVSLGEKVMYGDLNTWFIMKNRRGEGLTDWSLAAAAFPGLLLLLGSWAIPREVCYPSHGRCYHYLIATGLHLAPRGFPGFGILVEILLESFNAISA